ncbi:UDP-glucose 4-epimerase [Candidatus Pelagibacter sp. HTCC7211]|uniref:SDR family oxidoreductase n=1 Tax=Pelagibacter sp. (strain HTCC7211) TaxID=439493 RepID=UPI000183AC85|nr:SDR family oxidoreductase [Candidatus Pelagibacter sp. HTCC7211]EDZ59718.1 UDP-glucose 4-epimerase [Candidatus Pelagibacter sp. HTCC7211]
MTEIKKIFITGGAGYVGAMLAPFLISKGYELTIYDLMIYGEDVIADNSKIKKVTGDIRDIENVKKSMKGHDAVIHLACISNDPSFELNPNLGKSINLDAFEPMVKIARELNVKRFIYASSSSVYGIKNEINVHEDMALEPLTDYSKFKAECESILSRYNTEDFTTVTIRPATVCGYSTRQRLDVVVNILTNLAYHKRKITVFGGEQLRPNLHIKDMIESYYLVLNAKKNLISNQIFNVGFENQKVIDLANVTKKIIGEDVVLETTPTNDNRSYHISSKKITEILNFKTQFTVQDAVIDLKKAFDEKLLVNSLENEMYFNIKRMQSYQLK